MNKLSKKNNNKIRKRIKNTKKRHVKQYGGLNKERVFSTIKTGAHGAYSITDKILGKLVDGVKNTLKTHEYKFKDYENSQKYFEDIILSPARNL